MYKAMKSRGEGGDGAHAGAWAPTRRRPRRRLRFGTVLAHAVIITFLLITVLPLAWVLLISVKTLPDAMRGDFLPSRIDFAHYRYVLLNVSTLPQNLVNSLYVTLCAVAGAMACSVLGGYALVHMRPRGSGVFVALLFLSLYVPIRVVSLIGVYETQHWLGLINNTSGLILPYVALQLSISILIMRSMFLTVPREMIDAALIDGASHLRILWSIGIPLVRHGLAVIFVVNFVAVWGEFLLCVTLIDDQARRTVPVVLATAQGGQGAWAWPRLAATYLMVTTPALLVYALIRNLFFTGLRQSATRL